MRSLPIILLVLAVAGCGGSSSSTQDVSLDSQYRAALKITDATLQVTELLRVAGKQRAAGDVQGLDTSLATAANAASRISDAKGRAMALNRVALTMARMERPAKAKDMLKQVRKAADEIPDAESKIAALSTMCRTYGEFLGEKDIATGYLNICDETVATIEEPAGRILAQLDVAYVRHTIGDTQTATEKVDQILEASRNLEDKRKRADRLADAAAVLAKMTKAEEAKAVFKEAQQAASEIDDSLSQAYAYLHLSGKLSDCGEKAAARKVLAIAEQTADKVGDQSMKLPLMEKIYAAKRTT